MNQGAEPEISRPREGPLTRLVRQSAVALVGGIIGRVLFLGASILVIRRLDPTQNGEVQLALSLGSMAAILPELGLRGLALRRLPALSEDLAEITRTVSALLYVRLASVVISTAILGVVLPALGYSPSTIGLTLGFALFWMLDGTAVLQKFSFRGLGTVAPDIIGSFFGRAAILASTAIALHMGYGAVGVLMAFLSGAIIEILILSAWQVRALGRQILRPPTAPYAWMILIQALPFLGFAVVQTINQRLGSFLLSLMDGLGGPSGLILTREYLLHQIGALGAAYRIPEALMFLPAATASLLVPALVRLTHEPAGSQRMAETSLRFMVLFGCITAMVLVVFRVPIAGLVGAGKFREFSDTFAIFGAWAGVMIIQSTTLNVLIAQGIIRPIYWRYGLGIIINVIVTWSAGPMYGAAAAALGLLVADLLGVVADIHALRTRTMILSAGTVIHMVAAVLPVILILCYLTLSHPATLIQGTLVSALSIPGLAYLISPEVPKILHRLQRMGRPRH